MRDKIDLMLASTYFMSCSPGIRVPEQAEFYYPSLEFDILTQFQRCVDNSAENIIKQCVRRIPMALFPA